MLSSTSQFVFSSSGQRVQHTESEVQSETSHHSKSSTQHGAYNSVWRRAGNTSITQTYNSTNFKTHMQLLPPILVSATAPARKDITEWVECPINRPVESHCSSQHWPIPDGASLPPETSLTTNTQPHFTRLLHQATTQQVHTWNNWDPRATHTLPDLTHGSIPELSFQHRARWQRDAVDIIVILPQFNIQRRSMTFCSHFLYS